MTALEAYEKGYKDGKHDGYYSSVIKQGIEEEAYCPPKEVKSCDDEVYEKLIDIQDYITSNYNPNDSLLNKILITISSMINEVMDMEE